MRYLFLFFFIKKIGQLLKFTSTYYLADIIQNYNTLRSILKPIKWDKIFVHKFHL